MQDERANASLKNNSQIGEISLDGFETPDGLRVVAVYRDFVVSGESGLVILAMGKAYWTLFHEGLYVLCVAENDADVVVDELLAVAQLDGGTQRRGQVAYREFTFGFLSFILYGVVLIGCFILQQHYGWSAHGRVDATQMVESSQWSRAVTALTLHADLVHLVSNLVAGMGFTFFVARFFGAAAAWFLVLLSGALGNALNAWVYFPEPHFSVGASTGVFGALGLLTGIGIWVALAEAKQAWSVPKWFLPVLGGTTLLGLTGVGDGLVDVAAHISGFVCGLVFGFVGAIAQGAFVFLQRWKWAVGAASLCIVAGAWLFRLSGSGA